MEVLLVAGSLVLMFGAMVALIWLTTTNRELPEPRCSASRAVLFRSHPAMPIYVPPRGCDSESPEPQPQPQPQPGRVVSRAQRNYQPSQAARDAIATEQFARSMNRTRVMHDK